MNKDKESADASYKAGENSRAEQNGDPTHLTIIPLDDIRQAMECIKDKVLRTPLIPLDLDINGKKIFLKLENMQVGGSFKIRGVGNAVWGVEEAGLRGGVCTVSTGNFAGALARYCHAGNVPFTAIVKRNTPTSKITAIRAHKGYVSYVDDATWWEILHGEGQHDMSKYGTFLHPAANRHVIAGYGTIGLDILEQLPEVDVIIAPFGGGSLCTGIASVMKQLKSQVKVYASDTEGANPATVSLQAGTPTPVPNFDPARVGDIGSERLLPAMWNLVKNVVSGTITVTEKEISEALRLLLERAHVVAEPAGAKSVAAALSSNQLAGNIVCVVSGGNIDTQHLVSILRENLSNKES